MTDTAFYYEDTICAPATPAGGAISVIRISGKRAVEIANSLFKQKVGKSLAQRAAGTVAFGDILDEEGETLDEVLVTLFRAPHSYTGEDSVEISCHGSAYIVSRLLQSLIAKGCRMARPGEFTQRAFLNGKMDLSRAEAVADLIASTSAATHRIALKQMRGQFSKELADLREKLLHLTTLLELELDFSDHEDLEFADRTQLQDITDEIHKKLSRLASSFRLGNAIKNGIPVAIVGDTNAGKSTLLNTLLGEEKAIVSDVHGTTRDAIEDTVNIGGTLFRFIDTAGIRQSDDKVEQIGINRTFKKLEEAEIVLWVIDSTDWQKSLRLKDEILPLCAGKSLLLLFNKSDLIGLNDLAHPTAPKGTNVPQAAAAMLSAFAEISAEHLFITAQASSSCAPVVSYLEKAAAQTATATQNDIIITNERHYAAILSALADLDRVTSGLRDGLPGDLISQDLRSVLFHLAEITGGAITSDEVLHSVFKSFCIGK
ncbi:MAG: tRNA uridine-5-carboxymethylaminomethyl(34) synthesis GTPase MnmE [Bacteroidales bacterium]|nr:tRNA uridine-5-carboxymethylaminomethyl(34) synthesis GTPase MnmE [Bacteroidales bacterium]